MYELLSEKLRLFDGVFGASDEVLGALESGVDFEKRINEIYQNCRTTEEINEAFDGLQEELDEQIRAKMQDARSKLFEHFDEDVHTRLKSSRDDTILYVNRFEQWLNAVETVSKVTGSEIWKRAAANEKRFIEVPYQVPDEKNPNRIERGVIDLAFRENDGWVIVDYKTDSVTEESTARRAEEYAPQLRAYAEAWQKALGEPVSETGLYFTIIDKYIKLK